MIADTSAVQKARMVFLRSSFTGLSHSFLRGGKVDTWVLGEKKGEQMLAMAMVRWLE